jgi:hypothetical protein
MRDDRLQGILFGKLEIVDLAPVKPLRQKLISFFLFKRK